MILSNKRFTHNRFYRLRTIVINKNKVYVIGKSVCVRSEMYYRLMKKNDGWCNRWYEELAAWFDM